MGKKYGKWQKGNAWNLSSKQMENKFKSAGKGVTKPTAIQQEKGRWRIYHKPIQKGEFWD